MGSWPTKHTDAPLLYPGSRPPGKHMAQESSEGWVPYQQQLW